MPGQAKGSLFVGRYWRSSRLIFPRAVRFSTSFAHFDCAHSSASFSLWHLTEHCLEQWENTLHIKIWSCCLPIQSSSLFDLDSREQRFTVTKNDMKSFVCLLSSKPRNLIWSIAVRTSRLLLRFTFSRAFYRCFGIAVFAHDHLSVDPYPYNCNIYGRIQFGPLKFFLVKR